MTLTEKTKKEIIEKVSDHVQNELENSSSRLKGSRLKRIILFITGYVSLGLGILGIVLPILPTTPFLLLAAACFARNSEKMYNWLITNKLFGKYIRNYREGKGVPLKIKIYTLFFLWFTIILSILFVSIFWVRILLLIIATLVSIHVILIRPKKKEHK